MKSLSFSPQLPPTEQALAKLHELCYQGLYICNLLIEEKEEWISDKPDIVSICSSSSGVNGIL